MSNQEAAVNLYDNDSYHDTRFTFDEKREVLWKTLVESWFSKHIPADACVVELGAGYGHFINNVRCRRRIALDIWDGMLKYLREGVEGHVGPTDKLEFLQDNSVDYVFASNLFEHVSKDSFVSTLTQLRRVLKPGGTINILQPNYRFCFNEYFDDFTHVAIWSDRSLSDFLDSMGFEVLECWPRFLPLTVKSRLPVSPALIRLYLSLPVRPMGKQMFIRAKVRK